MRMGWRDQDLLTADLHHDPHLPRIQGTRRIHAAGDIRGKNGLEKPGSGVWVVAAQMQVVELKRSHAPMLALGQ
jgi:hypothetical protein